MAVITQYIPNPHNLNLIRSHKEQKQKFFLCQSVLKPDCTYVATMYIFNIN